MTIRLCPPDAATLANEWRKSCSLTSSSLAAAADAAPGLFDVHKVPPWPLPANHIRIALKAGNGLQQCECGRIQVNGLPACLAVGKKEAFVFLADVLPAQREDFISPRSGKCEQANRSDYPRGTALVLAPLRARRHLSAPSSAWLRKRSRRPSRYFSTCRQGLEPSGRSPCFSAQLKNLESNASVRLAW